MTTAPESSQGLSAIALALFGGRTAALPGRPVAAPPADLAVAAASIVQLTMHEEVSDYIGWPWPASDEHFARFREEIRTEPRAAYALAAAVLAEAFDGLLAEVQGTAQPSAVPHTGPPS